MPEIVNMPNNYQDSDIFNKISLPKDQQSIQKTLDETRKLQKNVSNIDDSEEKKRKREDKKIQKEK
ncbi:hypothetical protein [Enterococcus sp. DIV1420a]|uniref:hypothetical protein n=1 Tax=Enterococcus sp. DIV1420a TaxID=2774672 RepID=UPI003F1F9646